MVPRVSAIKGVDCKPLFWNRKLFSIGTKFQKPEPDDNFRTYKINDRPSRFIVSVYRLSHRICTKFPFPFYWLGAPLHLFPTQPFLGSPRNWTSFAPLRQFASLLNVNLANGRRMLDFLL